LPEARAADLALAQACARGEPHALVRFERELFGEIDAAHARFRNVSLTRDELRQAMRDRLFVARDGAPPRIASYQGRGDLRAWVRMATTRYLVDVVRAESARPDRPAGDDHFADAATSSDDPELAFLKRQYRAEFRAAFAAALSALDARDRNILRHRYIDGLEVNELATIYDIHRVSMSRTLARIRDDLLAGIRRELLKRMGSAGDDMDSLMRLIASQLELSLSGLLRTKP
jgi:RNA polymerase sigma-70 factor (ECF subfamily)